MKYLLLKPLKITYVILIYLAASLFFIIAFIALFIWDFKFHHKKIIATMFSGPFLIKDTFDTYPDKPYKYNTALDYINDKKTYYTESNE